MPAKPTTVLRQGILDALDHRLETWGFRRRKSSCEWLRHPRRDIVHGIHLNVAAYESVGRVHIIPTLEVGLESVERALVEAGQKTAQKDACSFARQLTTLLSCEYVAATSEGPGPMVARLATDVERHGLRWLDRLSSLQELSALLASPTPRDWPILLGRPTRARLLPLVLALQGRTREALDCFAHLRQELAERGELRADTDEFGKWLEARFGQAA